MTTDIDVVMAHRFLYYVLGNPVISDREYDKLEAPVKDQIPPVGSDRVQDYSNKQIDLATQLMTK